MNAPGSPSSPLQIRYFVSLGRRLDLGPLDVRGKAGAASTPQAADPNLFDDLVRRQFGQALASGGEPIVPQILIQIQRVQVAAVLGRDALLRSQEIADGRLHAGGSTRSDYPRVATGVEPVEESRSPISQPAASHPAA